MSRIPQTDNIFIFIRLALLPIGLCLRIANAHIGTLRIKVNKK
jgi:hypothetical protein